MVYIKDEKTGVTVEDNSNPHFPVRATTAGPVTSEEDSKCYSAAEAEALLRGLLRWKLEQGEDIERLARDVEIAWSTDQNR